MADRGRRQYSSDRDLFLKVPACIAALLVLLWVVLLKDINTNRDDARERAVSDLRAFADIAGHHFGASLLTVDLGLTHLRLRWQENPATLRQYLDAELRPVTGYATGHVCIHDGAGRILFSTVADPIVSAIACRLTQNHQELANSRVTSSAASLDFLAVGQIPQLPGWSGKGLQFSRPLGTTPDEGRILLSIPRHEFSQALAAEDLPEGGALALIDDSHHVLWFVTRRGLMTGNADIGNLAQGLSTHAITSSPGRGVIETYSHHDGVAILGAWIEIEGYPFTAFISQSLDAIYHHHAVLKRSYLIFGLVLSLLMVSVGLVLIAWLKTRRAELRRLRADMAHLSQREAELTASRQMLRELAANEFAVRDEEEARIARELHDELGQRLTVLRMDLAMLPRMGVLSPYQMAAEVAGLKAQVDGIIGAVRHIIRNLRPVSLEVSLVAAVQGLLDEFRDRFAFAVELYNHLPDDIEIPELLASTAFRIIQEAITNTARHADASRVVVELGLSQGQFQLYVRDTGRGFNSQLAPPGFGLNGMRERVAMLGGSLTVTSTPGQGTRIEALLPLPTDIQGHWQAADSRQAKHR